MKVRELIAILQQLEKQDQEIKLMDSEYGAHEITEIEPYRELYIIA